MFYGFEFPWMDGTSDTPVGSTVPADLAGPGCVFCRIIGKELPAEILYETGRVISILDIRPIHYGHALVIPKLHCPDFLALPEGDLVEVMKTTQIVSRAIVDTLGLEGFNFFSNNGRIAGQSVFHFHLHLLGGRPFRWPPG